MTSSIETLRPEPPLAPRGVDGDLPMQNSWSTLLYWMLHAVCLLGFATDLTAGLLLLFGVSLVVRLLSITGGYHRYFSHRTYKTSRVFAFLLALVGCTSVQKGPLWWAACHRRHHRYSDQPGDVHSPKRGFAYSHYGWIFSGEWDHTESERVRDLSRYPELVWLNRFHFVPAIGLGVLCFALAGWAGVLWGLVIPTVLLWHMTYTINSLAHVWGRRRYDTDDDSRNNWLLALLTAGEGWHNNHHHYMSSTRQGFFWWEVDLTYYVLRALQAVGLVWDIKEPPAQVRELRP